MNYRVMDEQDGEWLFTAPELQVGRILDLHADAFRRMTRETQNGGVCVLHGNGKYFINAYPVVRVSAE